MKHRRDFEIASHLVSAEIKTSVDVGQAVSNYFTTIA
jgi:hypothetical protein